MYLPHFISWVIIGGIMINFLSINGGIINRIIELTGGEPIYFMASKAHFRSLLVLSHIWRNSGWGTIIYLAALTGVDQELYQAAVIDGANRWKQIWNITIPSIRPTIVVMLILTLTRILDTGFDQVLVLYNPLVMEVGDIIDTYVYRTGLQFGRYSFAASAGLFKSLIAFLIIICADKFSKKIGESGIF